LPNLRNILLWVQALESDTFKQATRRLHDLSEGGYCCLGVACVIAEENGVKLTHDTIGDLEDENAYETYNDAGFFMPNPVSDWLGLSESNPKLCGHLAAWWNDRAGVNFTGLAALIRQEFGLASEDDWTFNGITVDA
jgi:hypothetical protein